MKDSFKLILPNKKYIKSFARGLNEFRNEESNRVTDNQLKFFSSAKDFPNYIKKMNESRKGINLSPGRVMQTTYWAMRGDNFVGILKLRPKLNKMLLSRGGNIGYSVIPSQRKKGYATEMLKLGLGKAKKLGIKKVLITCLEKNVASRKVIEANGGILENKIKTEEGVLLRFWVKNSVEN